MKVYHSIVAIFVIALIAVLSGCSSYSNYTEISGYKDYISDNNTGYDDIKYFNVKEAQLTSQEARDYFSKNARQAGDFIVTDYEDGICINKFCGNPNLDDVIEIPEKIEGKPVVKIGGYYDEKSEHMVGAFGGYRMVWIKIPSTVKVISENAVYVDTTMVPEDFRYTVSIINGFEVDENNPYYSSRQGTLYSKDFKKLLWLCDVNQESNYVVPDEVEVFEPSNGVWCLRYKVTFGKNVKTINTYIDKGESGYEPDPEVIPNVVICGYKGSEAERWAKEQYAKFEVISE